jgi:hypothetical protein
MAGVASSRWMATAVVVEDSRAKIPLQDNGISSRGNRADLAIGRNMMVIISTKLTETAVLVMEVFGNFNRGTGYGNNGHRSYANQY